MEIVSIDYKQCFLQAVLQIVNIVFQIIVIIKFAIVQGKLNIVEIATS